MHSVNHAYPTSGNNSVKVTLVCVRGVSKCPTRHLGLSLNNPSITIGRASKNTSKNIQAHHENGFFDCAVMSREHAVIYLADGLHGPIMIRDTKSLHGTFVNDSRIEATEAISLKDGDTLKFGDQIARMQDLHHGVEVRVDITRPPRSRFDITPDAMPSQSFLKTKTNGAKTIVYTVPECSDDEDDLVSVRSVGPATRLSRSFGGDENLRSSGLSQNDPVIVDDEDVVVINDDAHHERFPDAGSEDDGSEVDSEDSRSEVEYPASEDDGHHSPLFEDDGDNESIASEEPAPPPYTSLVSRIVDDASDDGEVAEPTAESSAAAYIPMSQPITNVSSSRTLLNPEPFTATNKMQLSDILAPIPTHRASSRFDIPPPSLARTSTWAQEMKEASQDTTKPAQSSSQFPPCYRGYNTFGYLISGTDDMDSQWSTGAAELPIDAEVGQIIANVDVQQELATSPTSTFVSQPAEGADGHKAEADMESKKRKRDEVDEGEKGDNEAEDGDEDIDNSQATVVSLVNAVHEADESTADDRRDSASELPEQSTAKVDKAAEASTRMRPSCSARKAKTSKRSPIARPVKRARTNSFGLVLTAAAGAVGGCVFTVGFLMSPIAERLLA